MTKGSEHSAAEPLKLRRRKKPSDKKSENDEANTSPHDQEIDEGSVHHTNQEMDKETASILATFMWVVNAMFGIAVMVVLAYKYSVYIYTLHENNLWFSNIKEVEREISFRTESGLYYSYYKQMVTAPSLVQGLHDLTLDNKTEHLRTINILERFNIYQEVALAALYKLYGHVPFAQRLQPIIFYIYSVFALNGLLLCFLFLLAWSLSGSWLAGVLAAAFYVFNKNDTTRVPYTIPLRESFALPFLWGQILFISLYIGSKAKSKYLTVIGILLMTFLLTLTWQFAQFVLLLQAASLYAIWVLDFVPTHKIRTIYLCQLGGMFGVYAVQFGNSMLLGALVVSLIPSVFIVMLIKNKSSHGKGIIAGIFTTTVYSIAVAALTLLINKGIKIAIQLEADEHIFKFVLNKFGIGNPRDFDSLLYMCNDAFNFLGFDTFKRMTDLLVFPPYVVVHGGLLLMVLVAVFQNWSKPEYTSKRKKEDGSGDQQCYAVQQAFVNRPQLAYHTVQIVLFGSMATAVLRMKYLWTPYMCVFAAFLVADKGLWGYIIRKIAKTENNFLVNIVRHALTIGLFSLLLYRALPDVHKELEDLREFYDPDTVDLMEWISANTDVGAAFTGSMQLLAGVRLCTGRPLTNHPHYEDKVLRERTRELYQMYGKRTPEDVHAIMLKYNASYMILEDSICLSPNKGCRLPDIMDLDRGILPTDHAPEPGLEPTDVPQFCDMIRHMQPPYSKYFQLVFNNNTFRVYKILVFASDRS